MARDIEYEVEFRPAAVKDFDSLSPEIARRILRKIERMRRGLVGDVKRLTNFTPEFRLRVGDYRVLFTITGGRIVVYRVLHRREAYDG